MQIKGAIEKSAFGNSAPTAGARQDKSRAVQPSRSRIPGQVVVEWSEREPTRRVIVRRGEAGRHDDPTKQDEYQSPPPCRDFVGDKIIDFEYPGLCRQSPGRAKRGEVP